MARTAIQGKRREQQIGFEDMNEAVLFNPRNCYQNYNVAVNLSDKPIYTYMGLLKPRLGNANYCSAGQLSPLLNDPFYRTIGIGTRVFVGGAQGYVAWNGTQHNPDVPRSDNGTPRKGAGTLTLIGDLKAMSPQWLRAVSYTGYGVSLSLAVGVPIPILDEEMMACVSVSDDDLTAPVVDYSRFYPTGEGEPLVGGSHLCRAQERVHRGPGQEGADRGILELRQGQGSGRALEVAGEKRVLRAESTCGIPPRGEGSKGGVAMTKKKVVLLFPADKVEEPIIYHLIKDHGLVVNILRAAIDPGKQGRMVVELSGDESQLSFAFNYLESAGVQVEPLSQEIQHVGDRCMSCTACVPICPTGALEVDRESWTVSFHAEKCVVCLSCVDVCIYSAVEVNPG